MAEGKLTPSVCIDAVFEGHSVEDALQTVADCGIPAFEFWCWWEKDIDAINVARKKHGLTVASCCTKFFSLVDPNSRDDYLEGLTESIEAAQRLDCKTLISQVGDNVVGQPRIRQQKSLVDGLCEAADLLKGTDITLVIEPLNLKVDHPGYYLVHSQEAFEIVQDVSRNQIKVCFDIYHQQISEGNLIPNIANNIHYIGHFHAAGHPGRNEMTSGEINYPEIFKAIIAEGYCGYVGLEYWPKRDPLDGLKEAAAMFA